MFQATEKDANWVSLNRRHRSFSSLQVLFFSDQALQFTFRFASNFYLHIYLWEGIQKHLTPIRKLTQIDSK